MITEPEFIPTKPLNTAVLFLIFNRLDTTKKVFNEIKKAKPPKIYIASDGARSNKSDEKELVKNIRNFITDNIDWNCEVKTLFREKNLGCKFAVSSAIDWFFENEEIGIILEDDCLPKQSFFWFCEELLNKYNNDKRINMITGTSYLFNEVESEEDYFFSKYISIWGWATWKDRWKKYDINMSDWKTIKETDTLSKSFYNDLHVSNIFKSNFDQVFNCEIDTWDFQWVYKCITENTFCITPYKNLVTNIGIDGTRSSENSPFINMPYYEILNTDSLKHPNENSNHSKIDKKIFFNVFYRFQKNRKLISILKSLGLYNFIKKIMKK